MGRVSVRPFRPVYRPAFHSVFRLGAEHLKPVEIAVMTADRLVELNPDKGDKIERTSLLQPHAAPKARRPVPQAEQPPAARARTAVSPARTFRRWTRLAGQPPIDQTETSSLNRQTSDRSGRSSIRRARKGPTT